MSVRVAVVLSFVLALVTALPGRAQNAYVLDQQFSERGYSTLLMRLFSYPDFSARRGKGAARLPDDGGYVVVAELTRRSDGAMLIGLAKASPGGNQVDWGDPNDGYPTWTVFDPDTVQTTLASIRDIAISPSGHRIYVLAESVFASGNRDYELFLFDADGVFLSHSYAAFDEPASNFVDSPAALAVAGNGKVHAIGTIARPGGRTAIGLARWHADGAADTSLGGSGRVRIDYQGPYCNGQCSSVGRGLAIHPGLFVGDPGVYVVGGLYNPGIVPASYAWQIALIGGGGTPASSFGTDGFVRLSFNQGGNNDDYAEAIAVRTVMQWNGGIATLVPEIFVAGSFATGWSRGMSVRKLNAAGEFLAWSPQGSISYGGCEGTAAQCSQSRDILVDGIVHDGGKVLVTGQHQLQATPTGGTTGQIYALTLNAGTGEAGIDGRSFDLYPRPGAAAQPSRAYSALAAGDGRFVLAGYSLDSGSGGELYPALLRVKSEHIFRNGLQ